MTLTVGSLFSGIGGIDLGLERAGMNVLWHSEINPYACRVLKKHWPHVSNIGNITEVDWSNIPYVDVIAGGYPCQPFSLAGKRAGENDPRHLWPYFRDAISHLRPRYALLENVRGHLTLVGANHRRDRLIIVAYPDKSRLQGRQSATNSLWQTANRHFRSSGWWQTEPAVGRVADGIPRRVDRLRGLGNAVVPQVAEVVGRLIVSHADA